jgi:uncharacterized protein YciU (UPF0263 family)
MDNLESLVNEALDNAKDNGYDVFLAGSPEAIADDLVMFDAALEDQAPVHLIPHVITWQRKQGVNV